MRRSLGWGLLEALLCSLLLCTGLVMLLKGQSALREHSDASRERAAAAVLAEAEVERLRAQTRAPTEPLAGHGHESHADARPDAETRSRRAAVSGDGIRPPPHSLGDASRDAAGDLADASAHAEDDKTRLAPKRAREDLGEARHPGGFGAHSSRPKVSAAPTASDAAPSASFGATGPDTSRRPAGATARASPLGEPRVVPGKSGRGGDGRITDALARIPAEVPAAPPAAPRVEGPPAASTVDLDSTRYLLTPRLVRIGPGPTRELDLTVRWQDRIGDWQVLRWPARVGLAHPGLAVVAMRRPPPGNIALYGGRHAAVPGTARDLGEGHAVLQPDPATGTVWILDVRTAQIVGLCELGDRSVDDLRAAELADCSAHMATGGALLLSGVIQFDLTDTPSPVAPHSSALPLRVSLTLRHADASPAPPQCASNATAAVARGLALVSYHCLVFPRSHDQRWSGRSELAGVAGDLRRHRVCRYSADHDHDGRLRNIEHPPVYEDVDGPLTQQNFLVIRAGLPCPDAPPDPASGRLLDLGTVSHQPPT